MTAIKDKGTLIGKKGRQWLSAKPLTPGAGISKVIKGKDKTEQKRQK